MIPELSYNNTIQLCITMMPSVQLSPMPMAFFAF